MTDRAGTQITYLGEHLSRTDAQMIDPREFGRLESEVQSLQRQVTTLTDKVDALLELANKSKGGFWMGMTIASLLGAFVTFLVERVAFK